MDKPRIVCCAMFSKQDQEIKNYLLLKFSLENTFSTLCFKYYNSYHRFY